MNPVKAKIVHNEKEYKFSSYNDYLNKTNFINSKILNLIFNSEDNYLDKFKSIKYQSMNFEKENINSINFIKKFINYLIVNEYNFSKAEIATILNISRATLYRKLKEGDDKK